MGSKRRVFFPPQFEVDGKLLSNRVQQLRRSDRDEELELISYSDRKVSGLLARCSDDQKTLITGRKPKQPVAFDSVLHVPGLLALSDLPENRDGMQGASWSKPTPCSLGLETSADREARCLRARDSWRGQFAFAEEERVDGRVITPGLRPPQIGALHATLAHWKVTHEPATIVMPTGTGKTETMLALLLNQRLGRLLVVVPNAALREQIADKFTTLGLLKNFGVVGSAALYPVVGMLEHRLRMTDEADAFFRTCNVVVTTMHVLSGCTDTVQRAIASLTTHLFIDEAHHVPAPTWDRFRRFFLDKSVLQFTATPFRSDGKHVDGKVIFNYPLRKAQAEGYFRRIRFRPVAEFNTVRADDSIARTAVAQLDADIAAGLDHLVMARAATIKRAESIVEIYRSLAPHHAPQLVHNDLSERERRASMEALRSRDARVVVCVDMFGEGFDLPELKIAALHDMHKSLAITLQFTGRFTRTNPRIGDATMIANVANPGVEDALRELYAEDADWNEILRYLSEGATKRQERRSAFLKGFTEEGIEIPLQNVFPKMSAVVYYVKGNSWRPERVREFIPEVRLYAGPIINHAEKVLLFVTREREPIPWGSIKDIQNTVWDLYLVHWDSDRKLLYINSSNNDSYHEELAEALCGDEVELVRGEQIFKCLHGVNRLILMNLGLKHSLSRAVRFSMYVGSDIREGLAEANYQNKIKSNLFGLGFENGEKASVGCSQKGRVWSYKIAYDMSEWKQWCYGIGTKILDATISVADIFKNVIVPTQITERPALVPLAIEWPDEFLERSKQSIFVDVAGEKVPFYEAGMELVTHEAQGPLRFRVFTETLSVEYEIVFRENSVEFAPTDSGAAVEFEIGRKRRTLSEWFQKEPPIVRFENGAFLVYNELCVPPRADERVPFDPARIQAWDWTGTNIRKESQGLTKETDSIQYRVIQELLRPEHDPPYDIVYDDDSSNEAADVVAIKTANERLIVHLFHCKFSKSDDTGARVKDLYEVCGQAQRSVYWKGDMRALINHLRNREGGRLTKHAVSRFERGDLARLNEVGREVPYLTPEFRIIIVQPGLPRGEVKTNQLELLAATELYLMETHGVPLDVVGSQ